MKASAVLYSAVGEELTRHELDVESATLVKHETISVPAFVQYAWPHPSRRFLYVATSNRGPGLKADFNDVSAYRIDPATGMLAAHGAPRPLPVRAVHICVDPSGRFLLSARNLPRSGITVHQINDDGTIGSQVKQADGLDFGIYPHQVMVTPSGREAILVDRGNDATENKREDPGALRQFRLEEGVLSPLPTIAPDGGYGFGPRHLDFHPTEPWVYVSLERQSRLFVYRMSRDVLEPDAAFIRELLADRNNVRPTQHAGTVHVHPNGRFVYVANRADWTVEDHGQRVFGGGENSIVVYAIDPIHGEPTLVQRADTHSIHVRTFGFDPSGRIMLTASIKPVPIREGEKVAVAPAALCVFRVGDDGRLEFVRKYDVDTHGKIHYWMGIVGLA